MYQWALFGLASLALFSSQVAGGVTKVEISVSLDNIEQQHKQPKLSFAGVTEPAWVTELLGPTEAPVTTKRPSLPDRIRETIVTGIQQVGNHINEIPDRINAIFQGIQQGATNIIRRPTAKPGNITTASVPTVVNSTTAAPATIVQ